MNIDGLLMSLLIFSFMIVTGTYMVNDVNTNYDLDLSTSDFNETYSLISEMYPVVEKMENQTLDANIESSDQSWESMNKGTYSAVRGAQATFSMFGNLINIIAEKLKIPSYIVQFLFLSLMIGIVWAIVYMVLRFKP